MTNLLSINDLNLDQALNIMRTAAELEKLTEGGAKKLPTLRGFTIVNLFYEDSTRTRISFESAAKRLSAQTLQAMGADAVVIRHGASGAAARLASSGWIKASVINAGDGTHEHPTQALLDAFTIAKRFNLLGNEGEILSGLKIAIVGDILHSRVARSNALLLTKLGAQVTMIAPPTLMPVGVTAWGVAADYSLDSRLSEYDVVMMSRIQSERMSDSYFPTEREYARRYGLNSERLRQMKDSAILLHPGPMNRGLEISAESADAENSMVLEQVSNGVLVRMAVLYTLLGGPTMVDEGN